MPTAAFTAPNPASQNWVMNYMNLTSSDWAAVCVSGSPVSQAGCLGTLNSAAFLKLNRLLGNVAALSNVPITATPNSVFIQQFNGDSQKIPDATTNWTTVTLNTAVNATCGTYLVEGSNIGAFGVANAQTLPGGNGTGMTLGGGLSVLSGPGNISTVGNGLRYQLLNATDGGYSPMTTPFYVLCIGSTNTLPITAASLNGISAA